MRVCADGSSGSTLADAEMDWMHQFAAAQLRSVAVMAPFLFSAALRTFTAGRLQVSALAATLQAQFSAQSSLGTVSSASCSSSTTGFSAFGFFERGTEVESRIFATKEVPSCLNLVTSFEFAAWVTTPRRAQAW